MGALLVGSWLCVLQITFVFRHFAEKARASEQKNLALAGTSAPRET